MGKIQVADYLMQELVKLGIEHVFGLPGDYNFNVLYAIENNPVMKWMGCTNELNAGYAADGYARVKGYGALVTTYGVGELSAVNAIAGSFAENIPVIHIVGVPATKFIEKNALIHHNFLNPDYYAFERVFSNVCETTAYLSEDNAKAEIDRILSVFINKKRPVYVAIPMDVCQFEIDNVPQIQVAQSDEKVLEEVVERALELVEKAKSPLILGDVLVKRFQARKEFDSLVYNTKFPVSNLLMGKGIVEADNKMYLGTFLSEYENLLAHDALQDSDCVISVGVINSDLNTYRTGLPFKPGDFIEIQGNYTIIEQKRYEKVLMKDVLAKVAEKITPRVFELPEKKPSFPKPDSVDSEKLNVKYIFPRLQEFLEPNDIIFAETGIIPHGFAPTRLKANTEVNTQTLWASIGWATASSLGGQVAGNGRRTIVLTGEGSHQLTSSEVSTMMRNGLKPIIFVLNNSGYTIERLLCDDPWDSFNDIAKWDYSKLPAVFEGESFVIQVRTDAEFDEALEKIKNEQNDKLCYVELFTEPMDLPVMTEKIFTNLKSEGDSIIIK